MHDPAVVILDEPTIGIDAQQVIEVRETVRRLRESHTVLFSSHILTEVEQVCDRVVILHQGRVVFDGPSSLLTPALLRELYGVRADELLSESFRFPPVPAQVDAHSPSWSVPLAQAA